MLESEGVIEPVREAREIVAAVLDVPKFWAAANTISDASPDVARAVIRAAMKRAACSRSDGVRTRAQANVMSRP